MELHRVIDCRRTPQLLPQLARHAPTGNFRTYWVALRDRAPCWRGTAILPGASAKKSIRIIRRRPENKEEGGVAPRSIRTIRAQLGRLCEGDRGKASS